VIENVNAPSGNSPGITVIQNVVLEKLESAIYSRDYEAAGQQLLEQLRRLKTGAEFIGYSTAPAMKKVLYSRFCAAVISLFADPKFSLSQEGFTHLAAEHAVMDLLFRASVFGTSDHLMAQLSDTPTESDRQKMRISDGAKLAKFLLTYSLRSGFNMPFDRVFQENAAMLFPLWVGMMSALLTVNQQAQDRRELLLGLHGCFEHLDIPDAVLPSLSDAYMYSSYGIRRDKHACKGTIHRMMAKMLERRMVKVPDPLTIAARRDVGLTKAKPTMLVCIEWFSSMHAMYRCYAPIIRQLRTKFHLVAMSRDIDIDAVGKAEFDEWKPVAAENLVLAQLVDQINEIAPDIIYHPSLGMALWWTVLASVRLAPIQFMTMGHPSSSQSPCMDYILCDEGVIGDPSLFSEKIVEYPHGSARFVMRHDAAFPSEPADSSSIPDLVKIAVPAMLCKLNAPFLSTLQQIYVRTKRKVEFHFFINMIGVNLFQAAAEIREWLPTAKIYERNNYTGYLNHLNECHFSCNTFPFGSTNGNIDAFKLGIPIVTLWGDQPHERYDGMMLRRAGMPEWLIAKTRDEYVDIALRLIDDDRERNDLRDQLRGTDIDSIFFGEPPEGQRTAIVDIVWNIFKTHEVKQ
jgi:hypothetical protein